MIRRLGALSLGALNVAAALALPQLQAAIASDTTKLGELAARIDIAVNPPTPPDPVSLAKGVAAALLGYNPLTALAQLASGAVSLQAEAGLLTARIAATQAIATRLSAALGTTGVFGYVYEGRAESLGTELQGAVASDVSGPTKARALVLLTTSDATWAALSSMLFTG